MSSTRSTTAQDRADEVLAAFRRTKQNIGDDLGPQLDLEDTEGHRLVLLLPDTETIAPALELARAEYGMLRFAAHASDASWVRREGDTYEHGDALVVLVMDSEGNVAQRISRYTVADDGTVAFGDSEEMPVAGGAVLDGLRAGMGL